VDRFFLLPITQEMDLAIGYRERVAGADPELFLNPYQTALAPHYRAISEQRGNTVQLDMGLVNGNWFELGGVAKI
jgi:hypothetical protein